MAIFLQKHEINHQAKGSCTIGNDEMIVFLQRQGCLDEYNFCSDYFSLEVTGVGGKGYSATLYYPKSYGFKNGGQSAQCLKAATLDDVLALCVPAIKKHFALNVRFAPGVQAYMYGFGIGQEVTKDDYYFTPYFYDEVRDCVVAAMDKDAELAGDKQYIFETGELLFTFENGEFDKPKILDRWKNARIKQFLDRALEGFHDCDRKKGQLYCKTRLVWLMSEYCKDFYGQLNVIQTQSLVVPV